LRLDRKDKKRQKTKKIYLQRPCEDTLNDTKGACTWVLQ